jgi:hypothetical protein
MVPPLLALVRLSRGDQPDDRAARSVGNRKEPPVNLAEAEPAFLAVVVAGVLAIQSMRIEKYPHRVLERHAMLSGVPRGLALVPLKQDS